MDGNAIVLVSGGLDSATALYWARNEGYKIVKCVHFQYGQSHANEIASAMAICDSLNLPKPELIKLNLEYARGASALMPLGAFSQEDAAQTETDRIGEKVSATFVPGRNIVMLAVMGGIADTIRAYHIIGGWNAVDYSGYPDCRPSFLHCMEDALRLGLRHPVRIVAPLVYLSKWEIIKLGTKLGVPYELTWSCYKGGDTPCGECPSCQVRIKGFEQAKLKDPALAS